MTLILSCLTQEFLVQVSDRRLTQLDGKVVDDNRNKSVLMTQQVAFGYTGLAYIQARPTDVWLAEVLASSIQLSGLSLYNACNEIIFKATGAFRESHLSSSSKRHAFTAVGWVCPEPAIPGADLFPIIVSLSNAQNYAGDWMPQAEDWFRLRFKEIQPTESLHLEVTGQQISSTLKRFVIRLIDRCVQRQTGPWAIIRILVSTVHRVADGNGTVGRNLLAVSIPKKSIQPGRYSLLNDPSKIISREEASFLCFQGDGYNAIQYGPHVVTPGGGQLTMKIHRF